MIPTPIADFYLDMLVRKVDIGKLLRGEYTEDELTTLFPAKEECCCACHE